MSLYRYFLPSTFAPSIFALTPAVLQERHINTLLLDIDNTIIDPFLNDLDQATREFLGELMAAGVTIILTSNSNRKRVSYIAAQLQVPFLHHTGKPSIGRFLHFARDHQLDLSCAAVVGDQLLTDAWFAKRLHLPSLIVEPVVAHDLIKTRINRVIDRHIRANYHRRGIYRTLEEKR